MAKEEIWLAASIGGGQWECAMGQIKVMGYESILVPLENSPTEFQTPARATKVYFFVSPFPCFFFVFSSLFSFQRHQRRTTNELLSIKRP
jgi:hypothetical protein